MRHGGTVARREPGALVFATSYTALGVARSLGRRGIPVWVLGPRRHLASVSRYAERAVPLDGLDERGVVDRLVRLADDHRLHGWVILPDGDKNVALLARNHAELSERYNLTVPPWDMARWALDKHLTYALAEHLGIDHPRTFYPTCEADLETLDGDFPMVLKPMDHEGTDRFSIINGVWKAEDREQLLDLYRQAAAAVGDRDVIAVQEMIPGLGEAHVCYATLCREGRVLASTFARRTRLLPIDFGSSSYDETIEPLPELEVPARRWLEAVGYTGLADFDFKHHAPAGRYVLLDVNVRPWGWVPLAAYAGVDFPYLAYRLALGEEVPDDPYEVGVRWVRTPYDIASGLQLMRRGALSWREWASSWRGAHHEMYEADDLVPALYEVPLLLKLVRNKLRGA